MSSAFPCCKWGRCFVFTGPKLINSSVRGCAPSIQMAALLWWVHLSHPRAKWGNALESWREGFFLMSCHTLWCEGVFHRLFSIIKFMWHLCHTQILRQWQKMKTFHSSYWFKSIFCSYTHKAFSLSLRASFPSLWFSQTSSLSSNTCKSFKGLILFAQTFKLLCNN